MFALTAAVLSACSKDTTADIPPVGEEKIYASIEGEPSRVQLNDQRQTTWTANDQIVVATPDELTLWRFDGKTGDRDGSFTKVGRFNVGNFSDYGFDKHYALYSYEKFYAYGPKVLAVEASEKQNYQKGSYGLHSNLMIGSSDDGTNYKFKNLLGYLCLKVTGNKMVKQIVLNGNKSEILSGVLYFEVDDPESLDWFSTGGSDITLDCGSGVQLSDSPTEFYFALPPMQFTEGLSVNIHFSDGEIYPKSTSKTISIERNTIQPMATIATGGGIDWQKVYIYHTGAESVIPICTGSSNSSVFGTIDWGDATTTLLGGLTRRYYYTDGAESHTITVKATGADAFSLNGCEGVTKIDLSEF